MYINKRDEGIDFVRGICISLVVFGHVPRYGEWARGVTNFIEWLYTFHVPIFVLLSGWFSWGNKGNRRDFQRLANGVIIPYYGGTMLLLAGYLVAYFLGVKSTANPVVQLGIGKAFLKWITGAGMGATWFLGTLGVMKGVVLISQCFQSRDHNKKNFWFCCALLILYSIARKSMPFGPICPTWFPVWFLVGYMSREIVGELPKKPIAGLALVIASLAIDSTRTSTGNFLVVVGMLLFFYGSYDFVAKVVAKSKAICFVGQNSLPVLIFHPIVSVLLRPIQTLMVQKFDDTGIIAHVVIALLCICVSLIIDKLISHNRFTRWFIHPSLGSGIKCPKD